MRKPNGYITGTGNQGVIDFNMRPGIYMYNGGPKGLPAGSVDYGLLIVFTSAKENTTSYKLHLLCDGGNKLYYRLCLNGECKEWVQIATVQ